MTPIRPFGAIVIRIGLILSTPSPHQVDLLNAIAGRSDVNAFIGYVKSHNPSRHWGRPTPDLPFAHMPSSPLQMCTGQLHRWVRSQQADVWILSSVYTCAATHVIARILRSEGERFAFLGEPPQPRRGLRGAFRHLLMMSILRQANAIIGTGVESARRYRELAGALQRVTSVPYYIDVSLSLSEPPISPPAASEPFRFVASSQLIHRKGLDVLIDACRQLPERGWTLDIYGDGPLKNRLDYECRQTGKPIFLRGMVPFDSRTDVFRGKHCFVFSTRWDGWGMVLPEAMAMGLPVITTDQAMSAYDFVTPGENGQIGPADDADFLASAMLKAMSMKQTLTSQSIAAKRSLRDYRPEYGAERLINFLSEVTTNRAA